MATVTGTFVDSAGNPLPASLAPEVRVVPSKPTITVDGQTIATHEQADTPDATTGAYSFDLEPTVNALDRDFHYVLRGSYKMPDGYSGGTGYTRVDVFEQKLYVPVDGGSVADLAVAPAVQKATYWEGSTPPPYSGDWLFIDPTYDPTSGAPLPIYTAPDGTTVEHGELVEWSA